jgi:glycosyltransferase involved in cell wall biosynthesis
VVVTSGFPRRSETFLLNELIAMKRWGMLTAVFATKPGDGAPLHPGAEAIRPLVRVLPAGSPGEQGRRIAHELNGGAGSVSGVHGYFAHEPAAVASVAASLLGVPMGFSAHARDVRKVSRARLAELGAKASCVIACNSDVAAELDGIAAPRVVSHGVDLDRFRPAPRPRRDHTVVLAVGRLVPKKGFDVLIDAAARVRAPVLVRIVGDGPERSRLAQQIEERGVQDRVELAGPATHADLPGWYRTADMVVVPSVVDDIGDRDGLPNVVLEAMACGLTIVGSDVGALGDGVVHGETGLLVPPGDARALAAAVEALAVDPVRRMGLGRNGRATAVRRFELTRCTERLRRVLEEAYA